MTTAIETTSDLISSCECGCCGSDPKAPATDEATTETPADAARVGSCGCGSETPVSGTN